MTSQSFYSRGKLLLSGEYLIIHGALSLAVPTKLGQKMIISKLQNTRELSWQTFINDEIWFEAKFSLKDFTILHSSNTASANYVQKLLVAAVNINPGFREKLSSVAVKNYLEFDISWGLGSSSSLLSNLAWWAEVDPFELHDSVSQGSGYDVACARADMPLLFQVQEKTKKTTQVDFDPPFADNLYFVYLGMKKDSQAEVKQFFKRRLDFHNEIQEISDITLQMISCSTATEFGRLINAHENILAYILDKPVLRIEKFKDFAGEIKSLGAWGGDFAMALWPYSKQEFEQYLLNKGLQIYFPYHQLVYGRKN